MWSLCWRDHRLSSPLSYCIWICLCVICRLQGPSGLCCIPRRVTGYRRPLTNDKYFKALRLGPQDVRAHCTARSAQSVVTLLGMTCTFHINSFAYLLQFVTSPVKLDGIVKEDKREMTSIIRIITLSPPIPLRIYNLPYWSNPPFLIFDIRTLWRSGLSARAPEC